MTITSEGLIELAYTHFSDKSLEKALTHLSMAFDTHINVDHLSEMDLFELFKKYADAGSPAAQFIVAQCYEKGKECENDPILKLSSIAINQQRKNITVHKMP